MLQKILTAILFSFFFYTSFGQQQTDANDQKIGNDSNSGISAENKQSKKNEEVGQPKLWQPNPKKAGLYSAILPGSGQLYNHQYWKIPIVYAGIGVAVYFIKFNSDKYQTYRTAYIASLEGKTNEFTGIYDQAALKQLQDGYKKYLDMTVLFTALGYTLQVMDAIVFAHLKNFDVSRDITLRVQPVKDPTGAGLGLVMRFK